MAAYIDGITGIMDQLEAIRKTLNNEKVGGIILGSNQKITVEFIKGLLLKNNVQQLALPLPKDEGCAFVNHSARRNPKNVTIEDVSNASKQDTFLQNVHATDGDKDWFLDSGATTHLTHRDE
ncbi:hypothetical protein T4C_9966 [Trichinella pseudospiralis]|uniref:Uncharacterized protein n=1 Tax=Trichinella pseudospiralis TaxID=6337 RepID=A0A0V1KFT9_TRIPS|nr:hypothetical protein T4C_9966 [Trichinella pseudospiralis]